MSSDVYFWNLRASMKAPFAKRMRSLLKAAKADKVINSGDLAAVKIHFGEEGTTGFLRPLWVKPILDFISEAGGKPFLTDASTLYVGQRGEAVSHSLCAAKHGWDPLVLGAPVIIADGLRGEFEQTVPVGGKHIDEAYIAGGIAEADFLVSVNHFKGHELAGYGGALKNIGMGSASKKGKMQQHFSTGPIISEDNCVGCESCVKVCETGALSINEDNGKVSLNPEKCVGCGGCFVACCHDGLRVDWKIGVQEFLERMMEYCAGVAKTKKSPACMSISSWTWCRTVTVSGSQMPRSARTSAYSSALIPWPWIRHPWTSSMTPSRSTRANCPLASLPDRTSSPRYTAMFRNRWDWTTPKNSDWEHGNTT